MKTGANFLVGTHDFRNFCKMDVGNGVVEFVRRIDSIDIFTSHSGEERTGKLRSLVLYKIINIFFRIFCLRN